MKGLLDIQFKELNNKIVKLKQLAFLFNSKLGELEKLSLKFNDQSVSIDNSNHEFTTFYNGLLTIEDYLQNIISSIKNINLEISSNRKWLKANGRDKSLINNNKRNYEEFNKISRRLNELILSFNPTVALNIANAIENVKEIGNKQKEYEKIVKIDSKDVLIQPLNNLSIGAGIDFIAPIVFGQAIIAFLIEKLKSNDK